MSLSNIFEFNKLDVSAKNGVIFDLDGTLADSMGIWCDKSRWRGKTLKYQLDEMYKLYRDEIEPFPYVLDMLKKLHENNVPTCILSATPVDCYRPFVEKFGIDRLVNFCTDCAKWGDTKNSGEPYIDAAKRLGLKPSEVIIFEDFPEAALAAAAAGLSVVAIYENESRHSMPELRHYCSDYIYNFGKILL